MEKPTERSKLQLLVVEDNRSVAALYNASLSEEVFDKRFATSGEQALEIHAS